MAELLAGTSTALLNVKPSAAFPGTISPVVSPIRLWIVLAFLASAQSGLAQGSLIGLPVIFVHGICDTPDNFLPAERDAKATLEKSYPLLYPQSQDQDYVTFYDGTRVWFQTPPVVPNGDAGTAAITVPASARFFLVALHDPTVILPSYERLNSNTGFDPNMVANVSIYAKGNELAQIIWRIKAITQAPRVIVVGHSMGGLDARAYIEGRASPSGDLSAAIPYLNDIAALVTLDTPHHGADIAILRTLANIPEWVPFSCQANPSIDKSEMLPVGPESIIPLLNYQDQTQFALSLPPALTIASIASTWAPVQLLPLGLLDTDDALFGYEQDLGSVSGISAHSESQLHSSATAFGLFDLSGMSPLCGYLDLLHSLTCTGSSPKTYSLIEAAIGAAAAMDNGTLQISPASATVSPKGTIPFTVAHSVGIPTWSIREGADAGSISPNGLFTAPATLSGSSETVHVEAFDGDNRISTRKRPYK